MSGTGSVILTIVLALVVLAGAAVLVLRPGPRGPGRDLRRRFGPEYDRVARRHGGDRAAAEQELAARVREHDALRLRPLDPGERERFERTWTAVQERFVDDPRGAAAQADQLIGGLLTAIGYPSEDREKQLDLAAVDHAHALDDYRQARELARRGLGGDGTAGHAETTAAAAAAGTEPTAAPAQAATGTATRPGPAHVGITQTPRQGTDVGTRAHADSDTDTDTEAAGAGSGDRPEAARDGAAASTSTTETLRQALLHYRVMFEDLLGQAAAEPVHAGRR